MARTYRSRKSSRIAAGNAATDRVAAPYHRTMSGRIHPLSAAVPLSAVAALAPDAAAACPGYYDDPCSSTEAWNTLALADAKIPVDGVLVLTGKYTGADADVAFTSVELAVTRDGQPIAGALEQTAALDVLVWRPTSAWQPGGNYQAVATVAVVPENCQVETPLALPFSVDVGPGPAPVVPEVVVDTKFADIPDISLTSLACCEGAPTPYADDEDYLGCPGYDLQFDFDQCVVTTTTGRLSVFVSTPAADVPFATQILYSLDVDGAPHTRSLHAIDVNLFPLYEPVCLALTATDLASGAVVAGAEQCFGQEYAEQLGTRPLPEIEPIDCPLEQCAVVDKTWDRTMCEPFGEPPVETGSATGDVPTTGAADDSGTDATDDPAVDADSGCGCATDGGAAPALLALALLVPRRRRVRR